MYYNENWNSSYNENLNNSSYFNEDLNNSSYFNEDLNNSSYFNEDLNNSSYFNEDLNNSSDYSEYLDYSYDEDLSNSSYYNENLNSYSKTYKSYHGYLSLVVCTFGLIGNIANIAIFTRKRMISSTNVILTALATSDMFIVLTYMPFSYQTYVRVYENPDDKLTYNSQFTLLVLSQFFLTNHVISVWITVTLAVWRFVAISSPLAASRLLTVKRTRYAIVAVYCTAIVVCIPQFLTDAVVKIEDGDTTVYVLDLSELSQKHNKFLERFTFWLIGIIMEIVPCVLLSFFTLGLIKVLYQANARRREITSSCEDDSDHSRINKLLLTILLLFVFSELPSGILTVLSEILGSDFHSNVYSKLAETIDVLDLVNHSFNCTIYYAMIRKYRETLNSVFNRSIFKNPKNANGVVEIMLNS